MVETSPTRLSNERRASGAGLLAATKYINAVAAVALPVAATVAMPAAAAAATAAAVWPGHPINLRKGQFSKEINLCCNLKIVLKM